jgi:hypothetical protein
VRVSTVVADWIRTLKVLRMNLGHIISFMFAAAVMLLVFIIQRITMPDLFFFLIICNYTSLYGGVDVDSTSKFLSSAMLVLPSLGS